MTNEKIYCQNCGHELDEGSKVCKRCNLVAAVNLENFLISKYKLLAVIGVFAALSVYLSTTATSNGNNEFLRYGSFISLSIVILLSLTFGWDLIWYSLKILKYPFEGEERYRDWFKLGFRFSIILLFISFFVTIVSFISFFILSDKSIATSLVMAVFFDFIILLLIATFYFPIRSIIENNGTIVRILMSIVLSFFGAYDLYYFMIDDRSDPLLSTITSVIVLVVVISLLIRSLQLIFDSMNTGIRSFTSENLKKFEDTIMEALKKTIQSLRETDVNALLFGGIGFISIILGCIVLNLNPPNYQLGYPTMTLGLACFVFGVSINTSKKTGKRIDQILENQRLILEEIKKKRESE
jgi:hypothetical protein